MIVTADPDIAKKCRMLRDHGQDAKYHHSLLGVNGRLDEIQAAVLRVKLPHLDEWNENRRNLAQVYNTGLPPSVVKPKELPWAKHVYHLYVIRTPHRERLRAWLETKGIATGMHYPIPIHLQDACRSYDGNNTYLPVTEEVTREILSLPMYPELSAEEASYVCNCVCDFTESKVLTK